MDLPLFRDIGIVAVVAMPLFFLIKWIAEEFKADLKRSADERAKWQEIINGFQRELQAHTLNAASFHEQVTEAHRFQREEHEKLMSQMDEVSKTLLRINGYKDEV
jgi:HSP90 family molecular chaperone